MWIFMAAAGFILLMAWTPVKIEAAFEFVRQLRVALCIHVLGIRVFFRRVEIQRRAPGQYEACTFLADGTAAAVIPLHSLHLKPKQKRWLHRLDKRRVFLILRRAFSLRAVSVAVETAGFDAARTALRHGMIVSLLGAMQAKLSAENTVVCMHAAFSFDQNDQNSLSGGCILATNLGKLIVAALGVAKSKKK